MNSESFIKLRYFMVQFWNINCGYFCVFLFFHNQGVSHSTNEAETPIPLQTLKDYVCYCRSTCNPILSEEAAKRLENFYVEVSDLSVFIVLKKLYFTNSNHRILVIIYSAIWQIFLVIF